MTTQRIPKITSADVERIVRRDYPPDRAAEVRVLLDEYGTEDWEREPERVRLAALKLAAGSIERLRDQVESAKRDYRDVLAPAEYPGYFTEWLRIKDLPEDEQQQIIDADWRQYREWFER